jgi:predicted metal-binding membrane protein
VKVLARAGLGKVAGRQAMVEQGAAETLVKNRTSILTADQVPQLPQRERLTVWVAIAALTASAWLVLTRLPMPTAPVNSPVMGGMAMVMGAEGAVWELHDAWLIFLMWTVMMAAMMLPSAVPMIEMHARIARGAKAEHTPSQWLFAAGYLVAWTGFAAVITAVQYPMQRTGIIGDSMRLGPLTGGLLMVAAGIYQFTPLKEACLTQCRSPIGFFMTKWRPGACGALRMGLNHGAFCIGCCWLLMALLLVAGVMNFLWAIALTIFVLLEKVTPWGRSIARASGAVMVASGVALAAFG